MLCGSVFLTKQQPVIAAAAAAAAIAANSWELGRAYGGEHSTAPCSHDRPQRPRAKRPLARPSVRSVRPPVRSGGSRLRPATTTVAGRRAYFETPLYFCQRCTKRKQNGTSFGGLVACLWAPHAAVIRSMCCRGLRDGSCRLIGAWKCDEDMW